MSDKVIQIKDGSDNALPISNDSSTNYCKMPDGTLIQWGSETFTNLAASSTGDAEADYPIPFESVPRAFVTVANSSLPHQFIACVQNYGSKSKIRIRVRNGYSSATTVTVNWLAIGRWK